MILKKLLLSSLSAFLIFPVNSYATENYATTWQNFTFLGSLTESKKWQYDLEFELDLKNHHSMYDGNFLTGGIGYVLDNQTNLWFGVDCYPTIDSESNPLVQNRFWQYVSANLISNNHMDLSSRTRLEERVSTKYSEVPVLLRQRFQVKFNHKLFNKLTPLIYNDFFFNLNGPNWYSDRTYAENRLFLGVLIPLKKNISLKIGYNNDLAISKGENTMYHVLDMSVTTTLS